MNDVRRTQLRSRLRECARRVSAVGVFVCSVPRLGLAQDLVQTCVDRHFEGQVAQRGGHLLRAHDLFSACARAECPAAVRLDCSALNANVEAALPSISPAVVDASGADIPIATVRLDERGPRWRIMGRALPLDPGRHSLTFEAPGFVTTRKLIVVREGERLRPVMAELRPIAAQSFWQRVPTLAYVAGGVGVAAGGFWTVSGISAFRQRADCESQPDHRPCRDRVNRWLLITDIAGGVTLGSLALAAYLLFINPNRPEHANPPARTTSKLNLTPYFEPTQARIILNANF